MADHRAILSVSEALAGVLRSSYRPVDFGGAEAEFEVLSSRDFATRGIETGVSFFLYRIYASGTNRTPPGRIGPDGHRRRPLLPLELHYLVTIWARQHTLQHSLAAWTMRTLEDSALLSASILNAGGGSAFRSDEAVDVSLAEMRTEDLFRIWEVLDASPYQLSIPYQVRIVAIESIERMPEPAGPPVQERQLWRAPFPEVAEP